MEAHHLIKQWLSERGMRQNHFADMVPVRPETLSRWLAGEKRPGPLAMHRLADMTGLPIADKGSWK